MQIMTGRVVVVEDDTAVAYAIGGIVESAGHRVSVFRSSTEAWDDLKATHRPRLLITNIGFPAQQPNGVALAAHARSYHHHLAVIFIADDKDAAQWTVSADGDDTALLIKPLAVDVLVKRLQELMPSTPLAA
jgi:DNA-binding NtrC family response regulator